MPGVVSGPRLVLSAASMGVSALVGLWWLPVAVGLGWLFVLLWAAIGAAE